METLNIFAINRIHSNYSSVLQEISKQTKVRLVLPGQTRKADTGSPGLLENGVEETQCCCRGR